MQKNLKIGENIWNLYHRKTSNYFTPLRSSMNWEGNISETSKKMLSVICNKRNANWNCSAIFTCYLSKDQQCDDTVLVRVLGAVLITWKSKCPDSANQGKSRKDLGSTQRPLLPTSQCRVLPGYPVSHLAFSMLYSSCMAALNEDSSGYQMANWSERIQGSQWTPRSPSDVVKPNTPQVCRGGDCGMYSGEIRSSSERSEIFLQGWGPLQLEVENTEPEPTTEVQ